MTSAYVTGVVTAAAWDGGGLSITTVSGSPTIQADVSAASGDGFVIAGNAGTANNNPAIFLSANPIASSAVLDGGSAFIAIKNGGAQITLLDYNLTVHAESAGVDAGSAPIYAGGFYTSAGAVSGAAAPISIDGGSITVYAPAGTPIQPAYGCVNANTGANFYRFNPAETGYNYWAVCSCGASTANGVGECKSTSLVGVTISSLATTQQICYTCWGQ
jgi:hypothetical protein